MAAEEAFVGQHRDGAGPGGLVAAGGGHRIEVCGDHPGGRRSLLDLRDERERVPAVTGQGVGEGAELVAPQRRRAQLRVPGTDGGED